MGILTSITEKIRELYQSVGNNLTVVTTLDEWTRGRRDEFLFRIFSLVNEVMLILLGAWKFLGNFLFSCEILTIKNPVVYT